MDNTKLHRRLTLIHFYLPRLVAADGSEAAHWIYAKSLLFLADNVLQQYHHHQLRIPGAELIEVCASIGHLEPVRECLLATYREDLTHFTNHRIWMRLKTSVQQVLPLVERVLQEQLSGKWRPS